MVNNTYTPQMFTLFGVKWMFLAVGAGIALYLLFFPMTSFATGTDVTLQKSTAILNIGGIQIDILGTDATISSIVVGAASFNVTVDVGSYIQFKAPSGNRMTTTLASGSSAFRAVNVCATNTNTPTSVLSLENTTAESVITVTPSATELCVSATTVSTSGGGGSTSGGGGSTPVTTTTATTATIATTATTATTPATTAAPATPATPTATTATPAAPASASSYSFTKPLSLGASGNDV
ncbi:MAG: hypothetical protein AAB428_01085, partial [Patescibacteria group bacterium]